MEIVTRIEKDINEGLRETSDQTGSFPQDWLSPPTIQIVVWWISISTACLVGIKATPHSNDVCVFKSELFCIFHKQRHEIDQ